jgi:Tfp pilus assembly protein PilO
MNLHRAMKSLGEMRSKRRRAPGVRLSSRVGRLFDGAGWPGAVGLSLMVFATAFYWSWLKPEETRLKALQQTIDRSGRQAAALAGLPRPLATEEKLASFYQFFPHSNGVPDQLEKIYAVAEKQALRLDQGEYRAVRDGVGRLVRYQIMLPVKGTYPQIRQFVGGVLTDIPSIALENVQFERQKIGEVAVEAKIKFVMYLERLP